MENNSLKKRVLEEMAVDYTRILEKNFDLAKNFVSITSEGKIELKNQESFKGRDKILLYLIGKAYAKESGLADTESVGNEELQEGLGIPIGSMLPWLKELRDTKKIKKITVNNKSYHSITSKCIEQTLKRIREVEV